MKKIKVVLIIMILLFVLFCIVATIYKNKEKILFFLYGNPVLRELQEVIDEEVGEGYKLYTFKDDEIIDSITIEVDREVLCNKKKIFMDIAKMNELVYQFISARQEDFDLTPKDVYSEENTGFTIYYDDSEREKTRPTVLLFSNYISERNVYRAGFVSLCVGNDLDYLWEIEDFSVFSKIQELDIYRMPCRDLNFLEKFENLKYFAYEVLLNSNGEVYKKESMQAIKNIAKRKGIEFIGKGNHDK